MESTELRSVHRVASRGYRFRHRETPGGSCEAGRAKRRKRLCLPHRLPGLWRLRGRRRFCRCPPECEWRERETLRLRQLAVPAGSSVEQRRSDFLFELPDLVAERGLRDVQQLSRSGEVKSFGEYAEVAKVPDLHGGSIITAVSGDLCYVELPYQRSTRIARSVFQRLALPMPVSISSGIYSG